MYILNTSPMTAKMVCRISIRRYTILIEEESIRLRTAFSEIKNHNGTIMTLEKLQLMEILQWIRDQD